MGGQGGVGPGCDKIGAHLPNEDNIMIPLRLTLENFLCYRDNVPTLDLEGVHLACLCGQNGHGKSALLDAITWALWGKARGKSQDDLIHHGLNEMQVELDFLAREARYRVVRRHARSVRGTRQGATDLQLQVSDGNGFKPITANTMRESQAQIDQLIGMDYDTFINTAFLLQGRADEFTNKSPGERKEVLSKVLSLGYYDTLQERAKERAQERGRDAAAVVGTLQRMRDEVARWEEYQGELERLSGELAQVTDQLEVHRRELDMLKAQVEALRRHHSELGELERRIRSMGEDITYFQGEIKKHESTIVEFQGRIEDRGGTGPCIEEKLALDRRQLGELAQEDKEIAERRVDLQRLVEQVGQLKAQAEQVKVEGQEMRSKLELLERSREGAFCPLCDTELGPEGHRHLAQNYTLQIEEKRRLYLDNQKTLETVEKDKEGLERELSRREAALLGNRRELERAISTRERELESYHSSQQEALKNLPQVQEYLVRSKEMLGRRVEELAQAKEARQQKGAELAELPQREEKLKVAEATSADLERRREGLLSRQGDLKGRLARVERMAQEIKEEEGKLKRLNDEEGMYQELVHALGRQGVQAMLIEAVLPQLETEANMYLGRMTDNRMSVKLETQRERKSRRGDPIETLEINISDELGPRSYEMFSGGEAFRINLALRIALSKVLAHRRGAPLPTLFIDEGFGTQDAAGRERILDVIRAIEDDFQKIIVITHMDELKDYFPVRIEVQKDETGSTFWLS